MTETHGDPISKFVGTFAVLCAEHNRAFGVDFLRDRVEIHWREFTDEGRVYALSQAISYYELNGCIDTEWLAKYKFGAMQHDWLQRDSK